MEFWGVEVKAGEPLKVKPEFSTLIHISQASVGEVKNVKDANKILLHLKVDGKDFVIGTLSALDRPQVLFDLVLHKEFEVSHDWKEGSIYLLGYVCDQDDTPNDFSDSEEDMEEDMPVDTPQNGKAELEKPATITADLAKSNTADKSVSKDSKVKKDEPTSDEDDDEDDEDDEDLSDDSEDEDGKELTMETLRNLVNGVGNEDDSDDDDDEDDEESDDDDDSEDDEHLEPIKKRPSETAKAPAPAAKKAKLAATNKSGEKNPVAKGNFKGQNQKPGGQLPKAQNKPFNKGNAPNSKAKGKAPNSKAKQGRK